MASAAAPVTSHRFPTEAAADRWTSLTALALGLVAALAGLAFL